MGIVFINKKSGITSFDSLREIKKELGTGKVGHTGTLDKFASGLLIVLTERDLKLTQWFMNCDKQYIGKIRFGVETDTLDPEGEVIAQAPLPTRELVQAILPQFTGSIMQTPPVYSALHIKGQRASELARAGKSPQMKQRPVTIYKLELRSWQPSQAEIFVHCSSGTYIRSLARDIALAAGSRGHLVELVRTGIAGFNFSNSKKQIQNIDKNIIGKLGLPIMEVTQEQVQYIKHGKPLDLIMHFPCAGTPLQEDKFALFCNDTLAAIVENKTGKWQYGAVLTERRHSSD